jgi:hypothetical protein
MKKLAVGVVGIVVFACALAGTAAAQSMSLLGTQATPQYPGSVPGMPNTTPGAFPGGVVPGTFPVYRSLADANLDCLGVKLRLLRLKQTPAADLVVAERAMTGVISWRVQSSSRFLARKLIEHLSNPDGPYRELVRHGHGAPLVALLQPYVSSEPLATGWLIEGASRAAAVNRLSSAVDAALRYLSPIAEQAFQDSETRAQARSEARADALREEEPQ